jgi:hypothetical protein
MSTIEPDFQPKPEERRVNRFDQLNWKLYFERWGCRECKTDRRMHHALGYCKICYHRVLERLQGLRARMECETSAVQHAKGRQVEMIRLSQIPSSWQHDLTYYPR